MKAIDTMKTISKIAFAALALLFAAACNKHEIDNKKSNYNATMEISASQDVVILKEDAPDEVALTITWTPAYDYGSDFIMTYQYSVEVPSSKASAINEYEDDGVFTRSYTNKQLHDMMVGHFGQLTSTKAQLKFSVTATYTGPRIVIPDMSSITIDVKTYGPKQFAADKVFMAGTAVGANPVELSPSASNSALYVFNGNLTAGKLNFPVVYGDENNVIVPASGKDEAITGEAQPATAKEGTETAAWIIPTSESYRVTLNFTTQSVTVIPSSQIFEVDSLFLAGTALDKEIKIEPTLENPAVYAFRGELKAGSLYLPVSFNEAKTLSIVPAGDSHDIADGTAVTFGQALTTQTGAKYWTVPADGVYRIVVDTDAKTIKIYSPATDPKNKQVSYNNTVDKINPYTQEVTELWMWGGFNAMDKDSDLKAGFQRKYTLQQSLANPYIFVYKGDALPRKSGNYNSKNSVTGATSGPAWLTFLVSSIENNVYAFGSTADAKRNDHTGTVEPALGETVNGIGGQGDHRYSYFVIPEGANFVIVDISEMSDEVSPANNTAVNAKVTFDKR